MTHNKNNNTYRVNFIKRCFDIMFSSVGLLVLFPLIIIISTFIVIKDSPPILYKQNRVGMGGKIFKIVKFRTMIINSSVNTISTSSDIRITALGSALRKYKLDELPELWNVFKGEMSFVGPRPDVPGYADKLLGDNRRILELRPGITGPASLKYANEEQILAEVDEPKKYNDEVIFPDKVRINLDYYNNWSLWLDIKIIFKTIFRKNY